MGTTVYTLYRRLSSISDNIEFSDAVEYTFEALKKIGAVLDTRLRNKLFRVNNYVSDVPGEALVINQIARIKNYQGKCFCDETDGSLIIDVDDNLIPVSDECGFVTPVCRGFIHIAEIFDNDEIEMYVLRKATSNFFPIVGCTECVVDEDKFDVERYMVDNDRIVYSFKEGYVVISYRTVVTDDEGLPVIPDKPSYLEAIEAYVLYRHYERMFLKNPTKVNEARFAYMKKKWDEAARRARNESTFPLYDDIENLYNKMFNWLVTSRNRTGGSIVKKAVSKNTNVNGR